MSDATRTGDRFADDPAVELDDAEREAPSRSEDLLPGDFTNLDERGDADDRAWDDLDRSPAGATTPDPSTLESSPPDPEFAPDPGLAATQDAIDTSAERSVEQPVASDTSFDRASADDLALSPIDFPEGEVPPDVAAGTERHSEPVAVAPRDDVRDDLIDDRGGDGRGVTTYLPPSGAEGRVERDASGRTVQRFDLGEIKRVEVEGPAMVTISTGGTGMLTVSAVLEDFERIKVMEGRRDVRIEFDGGFMDRKNPTEDITYDFRLTGLTDFKAVKHVAARVDRIDGGTVTVDLRGGSRLDIGELTVKRLEAKLADTSHLSATGSADRQVIDLSGESVYDGGTVQTDRTAVKAKDKSQASLRVKTLLRAQATKGSTVHYAGEHVDLDVHTEDKGEVRNVAAH